MSKNILDDDFDWNEMNSDLGYDENKEERQPVVMLRTFNTEEHAHLAAAALRSEGVDAHVISAVYIKRGKTREKKMR